MRPAVASAVPSEAELDRERGDVEILTKDDFAKLKSGQLTHAEMARLLLDYAESAESAATRYLLVRAAFRQYLLGDDLQQAIALHDRICAEEGAVYALEVARFSVGSLNKMFDRKSGGIKSFMERLSDTDRKIKKLEALKSQQAADPADEGLKLKLGYAFLGLGQWDEALRQFAASTNRIGAIARHERAYPLTGLSTLTSADVAEFWWNLPDGDAALAPLATEFRAHAVFWYRLAVSNAVLRSLKRTIALKRVAEFVPESSPTQTAEVVRFATNAVAALPPIRIPLPRDMEFHLVGCPAGTFAMGNPQERATPLTSEKLHRVVLTRPFWISRHKVARGQFRVFQKFELTEPEKTFGGLKAPMLATYRQALDYCEYLTKRYKSKLPPGYLFRLPTEAEWEYALAFGAVPGDLYAQWEERADEIMVGQPDWEAAARSHRVDLSIFPESGRPLLPVGLKAPNARGLYDMLGNGREYTLDTVNWMRTGGETALWTPRANAQKALVYEDEETDPLRCHEGTFQGVVMRGVAANSEGHPFAKYVARTLPENRGCFRIVAGPDLRAEQGIVKGRK
ncbi:MAG: formylglycine-generating enzyme family protein [Kiritimatiellia bacterium]